MAVGVLFLQFIDSMDVPVIIQRRVWVFRTVDVPHIQFIAPSEDIPVVQVVDISVVAQRQSPWSCSENHRDSSVALH